MALEFSRYYEVYDNTKDVIAFDLNDLPRYQLENNAHVLSVICSSLLDSYFEIALFNYIIDADIKSFHENLYRAAKSDLYLIQKHKTNNDIDWSFICASNIRSTQCALAIGDIELAREISKIQTKKFVSPYDPGDFYLYCMALRHIIEENTENIAETLKDFDEVRNGGREGSAMVLHALFEKDNDKFDEGIHQFLKEWKQIVKEDSFQDFPGGVRPGEEAVCIQALGFIRLAKYFGMLVRPDYPMIPKEILRYNDFTAPTDGYPVMED